MSALPDYFLLYGLPRSFSPDAGELRKRYYALNREHHPDRAGSGDAETLGMAAMVNEGFRILGNRDALMGYILKLEGVAEEEEAYRLPPDFLMEMMELNEAVGNVEMSPDMRPGARREAEAAFAAWEEGAEPLMSRYNAGERAGALMAALKDFYFRKKYLMRIKQRLD